MKHIKNVIKTETLKDLREEIAQYYLKDFNDSK